MLKTTDPNQSVSKLAEFVLSLRLVKFLHYNLQFHNLIIVLDFCWSMWLTTLIMPYGNTFSAVCTVTLQANVENYRPESECIKTCWVRPEFAACEISSLQFTISQFGTWFSYCMSMFYQHGKIICIQQTQLDNESERGLTTEGNIWDQKNVFGRMIGVT